MKREPIWTRTINNIQIDCYEDSDEYVRTGYLIEINNREVCRIYNKIEEPKEFCKIIHDVYQQGYFLGKSDIQNGLKKLLDISEYHDSTYREI